MGCAQRHADRGGCRGGCGELSRNVRIRPYRAGDLEAVTALWHTCGLVVPYNDPKQDIAFCRESAHGKVFVGEDEQGRVIATAMAGHDGHRGWLYYVAVAPRLRKGGLGRLIVHHAEAWLKGLGVRKVQLLVRPTNLAAATFYERLGYERSPVAVLQRWLTRPKA